MSTQPDRIDPQSPPEKPAPPVFDPPAQPDEADPLPPGRDHPGKGPDEIPKFPANIPAAAERSLGSETPEQPR